MNNLWLKIFSLLGALGLFYLVNNEGNSTVLEVYSPIEIRPIDPERVLLDIVHRQARVTIRGPAALVGKFASSPPPLRIRLPDDPPAQQTVALRPEMLDLPPYVSVEKIEPSEIRIAFDRRLTNVLPIEVVRIGQLPAGLVLEALTVEPQATQVSGAEADLKGVTQIETYPLDLRELREGETAREIGLRLPGLSTSAAVSAVKVVARVATPRERLVLAGIPVEVRAPPGELYTVTPHEVRVELEGTPTAIRQFSRSEVSATVRIRQSEAALGSFAVKVEIPEGMRILKVEPSEVAVTRATPQPTAASATDAAARTGRR